MKQKQMAQDKMRMLQKKRSMETKDRYSGPSDHSLDSEEDDRKRHG